jgi:hypothetical protein
MLVRNNNNTVYIAFFTTGFRHGFRKKSSIESMRASASARPINAHARSNIYSIY